MRLYLLAATLAAAVEALPGASSTISASASASSSSASSTSSNDAPKPTDIQKICEVGQQTQKAWKDLDMGFYINSTANMFCEDEEKCPYGPWKMDFMRSIADQTADKTEFTCNVGNDDCDIPGTAEMCTNETYARLWFILESCKNFHDHLQSVLDALHYGRTHVGNKQAKWVVTFTKDREDVMSADATGAAAAVILAGFFGVLAGLLSLLGPIGLVTDAAVLGGLAGGAAGAGIAGGGATIATGALNAIAANAAQSLQKEVDNMANMADALENGFEAAWNAVQKMGGEAINTTPENYDPSLGYTYKDEPLGAPAILNDGGFAAPIDWKDIRHDHLQMLQSITASAISYLWKKNDKALVVKVTGNMHDEAPCDIELSDDLYRVCDDDGTAYFYTLWEDVTNNNKDGQDKDWDKPYGIEHVEDENLDLLAMAEAAVYTSQQFGTGHGWDPESAAEAFVSDKKPPNLMMVDLPACEVKDDYFHPLDRKCEGACILKFNIMQYCTTLSMTDTDFPYDA